MNEFFTKSIKEVKEDMQCMVCLKHKAIIEATYSNNYKEYFCKTCAKESFKVCPNCNNWFDFTEIEDLPYFEIFTDNEPLCQNCDYQDERNYNKSEDELRNEYPSENNEHRLTLNDLI